MLFAAVTLVAAVQTGGCFGTDAPLSVEALVFSGSPNPRIALNASFAESVCDILAGSAMTRPSCRSVGFVGFRLGSRIVHAGSEVDGVLLDEFQAAGAMEPNVLAHCRGGVPQVCDGGAQARSAAGPPSSGQDCSKTPIVGPDTPPTYDVDNDDGGCFLKEQRHNNCYNYASDIVTNDFAQPGMGSGQKWSSNTCEDMQASAVRDGLIYMGNGSVPVSQPSAGGHVVALLIWPRTNFHWARMDGATAPFTWSHKPGSTSVRNTDNSGKAIVDPSQADFSPWTQFCGYFTVVPSAVTLKGDR